MEKKQCQKLLKHTKIKKWCYGLLGTFSIILIIVLFIIIVHSKTHDVEFWRPLFLFLIVPVGSAGAMFSFIKMPDMKYAITKMPIPSMVELFIKEHQNFYSSINIKEPFWQSELTEPDTILSKISMHITNLEISIKAIDEQLKTLTLINSEDAKK